MSLSPVRLSGTYFANGQGRFIAVGAHWVPAEAALEWPLRWDPDSIRADFKKMRDIGFNVVRVDLFWAWIEPYPGVYNEVALEQLDYFFQLGREHEIYVHPCLFVGGETGYYDVAWRHGRHPQADPELLRLQTDHASMLAERYREEPALFAWDLTDEPPFWIAPGPATTDSMAVNWTRLISGAVRREDPNHLVCVGTDAQELHRGPFRPDLIREEVDIFSSHPYPIYNLDLFPDPLLSERMTYCGAFQAALSAGAGHPVMIHELGASSAQYAPENIALYDRATMYSSLGVGANGFLLWDFTDCAPATYARVPYQTSPHETQFGITDWNRHDRPAAGALREFARTVGEMNLEDIGPQRAQAAILVPHEWSKPAGDYTHLGLDLPATVPYVAHNRETVVSGIAPRDFSESNKWLMRSLLSSFIVLRRAGLSVAMSREYFDWEDYAMVVLPAPLTSTEDPVVHVHTDFWRRARAYVEKGGALYASLCADVAIPEATELFGARPVDHVPVTEVVLTFVRDFGDIRSGETFRYSTDPGSSASWGATLDVQEGVVVATDQAGRPAIVLSAHGKAMLCAYPIESYLGVKPGAFDSQESTHRLYRAFALWAAIPFEFESNDPSVEVASLSHGSLGYLVLTNHSGRRIGAVVSGTRQVASAARLGPRSAERPPVLKDRELHVELDGYEGAVIRWES